MKKLNLKENEEILKSVKNLDNEEKNIVILTDNELKIVEERINARNYWEENGAKIIDWEGDIAEYMEKKGIDSNPFYTMNNEQDYYYLLKEEGLSVDDLTAEAKKIIDDFDYEYLTIDVLVKQIIEEVL